MALNLSVKISFAARMRKKEGGRGRGGGKGGGEGTRIDQVDSNPLEFRETK